MHDNSIPLWFRKWYRGIYNVFTVYLEDDRDD